MNGSLINSPPFQGGVPQARWLLDRLFILIEFLIHNHLPFQGLLLEKEES